MAKRHGKSRQPGRILGRPTPRFEPRRSKPDISVVSAEARAILRKFLRAEADRERIFLAAIEAYISGTLVADNVARSAHELRRMANQVRAAGCRVLADAFEVEAKRLRRKVPR